MSEQQSPFHSFTSKYPRSKRKAADVVSQMVELVKKGPRSMVGQVVDTTFHTTQGYVVATTQLGVVNVFGAPYGSLVPGMRIFCRQMGSQSALKSFIFDGFASNLSGAGYMGSFGYSNLVSGLSTGLAMTGSTGVPTSSSYNFIYSYFEYYFFYVPILPMSTITLWQMTSSSDGSTLSAEYLSTGQLRIIDGTGHGYISNRPISPHNIHWVISQPGLASLSVDNVTTNYTGIIGSGDNPSFSGGGSGYKLSLLSRSDGSQLCPLGSWISKFSFGTAWNGVSQVPLQSLGTGLGGMPTSDQELPCSNAQMDVLLLYQLLCTDPQGSSTLSDSAGAGGTAASIASGGSVLQLGPY